MRTVFPNREVPHKWAHQTQPHARGSGSVKFKGPAFYSYSTIVARIHSNKRGKLVLISENRYSATTAKHLGYVRQAISHMDSMTVPHVTGSRYHDQPLTKAQHRENFDHLCQYAAKNLIYAKRALQAWRVASAQVVAQDALKEAQQYSDFFGLRWKAPAMSVAEWQAARARVERIEKPDLASLDKRERARAQRKQSEYARERLKQIDREIAHALHPDYTEECRRTNWRLFDAFNMDLGCWYSIPEPVMLRLNGDEIETSMGARVPVAEASGVWRAVERARYLNTQLDRLWIARIANAPRIGDYPLDRIDADGTLYAGCHVIPYDELAAMARQLGLLEFPREESEPGHPDNPRSDYNVN
jgi:hypothetical protein